MRALTSLALVAQLLFGSAHTPAHLGSGDSVQPRNTVSRIMSVTPNVKGVRVDIVGGDAFVRVRSQNHDVTVTGYQGEQFLHIAADGTVSVNAASLTLALNKTRYANTDSSGYDPKTPPVWTVVSHSGSYMWHDHRAHWMSPIDPRPSSHGEAVQNFAIPLVVDGNSVTVDGGIYLRTSSRLWWLIVPMVIALVLLASRRWRWAIPFAAFIAGLKMTSLGAMEYTALPSGARITPVLLLFGALALVCAAGAFAWPRITRNEFAHLASHALVAGAGSTLCIGVWMNWRQVTSGYVPGLAHAWFAHAALPMALGVGVVAVVSGVRAVIRD